MEEAGIQVKRRIHYQIQTFKNVSFITNSISHFVVHNKSTKYYALQEKCVVKKYYDHSMSVGVFI